MPKRPRPALVTWTDACDAPTEWASVAKLATSKPVTCRSVGFLLAEDDERVVLATSLSDDGDAANGIVIPTSCVNEVEFLDAQP